MILLINYKVVNQEKFSFKPISILYIETKFNLLTPTRKLRLTLF